MGSSSSKAARSAATATTRRYPTRSPTHGISPSSSAPSTQSSPPTSALSAGQSASSGPTVHTTHSTTSSRTQAIDIDAADLDFAAALRSLGPVTPNPTLSHSSTFDPVKGTVTPNNNATTTLTSQAGDSRRPSSFPDRATNPAVRILQQRSELARRAEAEFEAAARTNSDGREFLDVVILRQILMLRDERGLEEEEIEGKLGLKAGVVRRLGSKGIVGHTGM